MVALSVIVSAAPSVMVTVAAPIVAVAIVVIPSDIVSPLVLMM